jgi:hypothetical protein
MGQDVYCTLARPSSNHVKESVFSQAATRPRNVPGGGKILTAIKLRLLLDFIERLLVEIFLHGFPCSAYPQKSQPALFYQVADWLRIQEPL